MAIVGATKYVLNFVVILCVALMAIKPANADRRKFIMLVEKQPTAMIYKRGILLNKWVPYRVDGFYFSEPLPFNNFARQFYIEDSNQAYKLEFFPKSSNGLGSCRISSRSTSKGKSLQLYRGNGETREYLILDDREDYLKFDCREE